MKVHGLTPNSLAGPTRGRPQETSGGSRRPFCHLRCEPPNPRGQRRLYRPHEATEDKQKPKANGQGNRPHECAHVLQSAGNGPRGGCHCVGVVGCVYGLYLGGAVTSDNGQVQSEPAYPTNLPVVRFGGKDET